MSVVRTARVLALVPARNEADLVAATVSCLRSLDVVDQVLVVDDASDDGTASVALASGATVLRIPRPAGKGRALEIALRRVAPPDVLLLADGDLGETAAALEALVAPVLRGEADLAVAVLPRQMSGGFGVVKRFARGAIRALSGFEATEPLSGQRAITAEALAAARPLASGFGVETAMTIDVSRAGLRIVEVPVPLTHRPTGRTLHGFAHRGRQGVDIARAVLPRALQLR
jgi:hypothetical protein